MNYKFLLILFITFSCVPIDETTNINFKENFHNSGFALVYEENLYKDKLISKKIDERSLIVLQKHLKPKTSVKITNLLNNKSIIATVGPKSRYPAFYNSVLSKRISKELELDFDEPYISIVEIDNNSTFVANKTKTFDEERVVAEKAPVTEIGIKNLSKDKKKENPTKINREFRYVIKIADFYYLKTANLLKNRIKNELNLNKVKINKLSKTEFRVYLGPYDNIKSLQKAFEQILILQFENLEILKI